MSVTQRASVAACALVSRIGVLIAAAWPLTPGWMPGAPTRAEAQVSQESVVRSPKRPSTAQRLTKLFDFEEASGEPVPRYWVRAQDSPDAGRDRAGFPIWNAAELDTSRAFGGNASVRLPTRGGSTSLTLERGVIPIFRDADYEVSAQIRTEGLTHARARLVARFLHADGSVVAGSERAGDLVLSAGRWTPTSVAIPGEHPQGAFLQIELQLLQPEQFAQRVLGPRHVWEQDFVGDAWFDEVRVLQLPRIEISTASPANIVTLPERPDLNFLIRDLAGERLTATLMVYDDMGAVVDRETRPITTGRTQAAWQPRIERLGWYRAVLAVENESASVGETSVDFIWIPRADESRSVSRRDLSGSMTDWRRFELIAEETSPHLAGLLPAILSRTGAGAVTIPAWDETSGREGGEPAADRLAMLIAALLERGHKLTLSMPSLPAELTAAAKVDRADPWALLTQDPALWGPFVDPLLDRFGQSVRRWQIGTAGDDRAFWNPARRETISRVIGGLQRLVPGPILCVPWRADLALDASVVSTLPGDAALRILLPQDMPGRTLSDLAGSGVAGSAADGTSRRIERTYVLATAIDERYGMSGAASDIARRLVEFWAAFGDDPSVGLPDPWTWSPDTPAQPLPKPQLAVLAHYLRVFAQRRVVGEVPIAPGVRCLILSGRQSDSQQEPGVLVAWNESASEDEAVLRGHFSSADLKLFDIFANEIPLIDERAGAASGATTKDPSSAPIAAIRSPGAGRAPELVVHLGESPIVISGIDPDLARFQASITIDPPFVEASNRTHRHDIVVSNPWPVPIEVGLRVVRPGGVDVNAKRDHSWRINPRQARLSLLPNETARVPLEITFSPAEEAGAKEFVVDAELLADRSFGTIRVTRRFALRSSLIDVQTSAIIGATGNVTVEAQVTNTTDTPLDLQLTAFSPTSARAKATITQLMPGNTALRKFTYADPAGALKGQRIVVTVEEASGKARVNTAVVIE
jgi:hypothetical protein